MKTLFIVFLTFYILGVFCAEIKEEGPAAFKGKTATATGTTAQNYKPSPVDTNAAKFISTGSAGILVKNARRYIIEREKRDKEKMSQFAKKYGGIIQQNYGYDGVANLVAKYKKKPSKSSIISYTRKTRGGYRSNPATNFKKRYNRYNYRSYIPSRRNYRRIRYPSRYRYYRRSYPRRYYSRNQDDSRNYDSRDDYEDDSRDGYEDDYRYENQDDSRDDYEDDYRYENQDDSRDDDDDDDEDIVENVVLSPSATASTKQLSNQIKSASVSNRALKFVPGEKRILSLTKDNSDDDSDDDSNDDSDDSDDYDDDDIEEF